MYQTLSLLGTPLLNSSLLFPLATTDEYKLQSLISLLWDKAAKDFLMSFLTSSVFNLGVEVLSYLLMTMSLRIEREFQWSCSTPDTYSSWFSNPILKLISNEYAIVWWVNTTVSAEGEKSKWPVLKKKLPYFVSQWGTKKYPCGSVRYRAYLCISTFLTYK